MTGKRVAVRRTEARGRLFGCAAAETGKNEYGLSSGGVPDGAGRLIIQAFAPDEVSVAEAIDGHSEVIAEGEAEAVFLDVGVAGNVGGDAGFVGPGSAAVAGTAVVGVPVGSVAGSIQAMRTSPALPATMAGNASSVSAEADETAMRGSQVSPPLVEEEK